jgi:hypothetical protein
LLNGRRKRRRRITLADDLPVRFPPQTHTVIVASPQN